MNKCIGDLAEEALENIKDAIVTYLEMISEVTELRKGIKRLLLFLT